ncbi:MAG: hypothetical protein II623_01860, partial [Paludibacteraceae bacterium]|nr:hypothetical protein [Paludibacteraceae bacterium]
MTAKERTAILRILIDMVKADCVIDKQEMDLFANLRDKYGLSSSIGDVDSLTLADACSTLRGEQMSADLLADVSCMVSADGQCTKQEALLFMALQYALSDRGAE